jgi:site-specific DNA recombinase
MSSEQFQAIRGDRVRRIIAPAEKTGAVIYCRVSTKDQLDGFSIETQEKLCGAYCLKRGYVVTQVYQEAKSAKGSAGRPEFQKMLKDCLGARSEIGAVVVYAVSRFARSAADHTRVRESLRAQNIHLLSVTEPFDDRTATGRWQENTLSVNAQYDNEVRSERTIDGMMTALGAGKWCHKAPIGYKNTEALGGLSLDSARADLVRKAFELYALKKHSKKAVLGMVTEQGLRNPRSGQPLSPQTFDKMLRNPLYAGWITSAWGISRRGQFEALVEPELFNLTQDRLTGKNDATRQTRSRENADFPLRVFVRCAKCGQGLTGSFSTGRRGKRYPYYCCRVKGCRAVKFGRDELHRDFHQLLYSLFPDEGFMPLFGEVIKDVWEQKHAEHKTLAARVEKELALLEAKDERLVDLFVNEQIDKATYDDQRRKVGTALDKLRRQRTEALVSREQVDSLLDFAEWILGRAAGIWNSAALPNRLRLQGAFFPEGLTVTKEGFGTPLRPLFFKQFEPIPVEESCVASPGGFERTG